MAVPAPVAQQPATIIKPYSLDRITSTGDGLPIRSVGHGLPGVGKTSWGSRHPSPIVQMAGSETGLLTLINEHQLPETPHFPPAMDWETLVAQVNALLTQEHSYKSYVLDTVNLWERLCYEHVCQVEFGGDWSRKGWMNYNAGPEMALSYEREFLSMLDRLREQKKMRIVMLAHTKIKNFKNPEGADFDRYTVDVNEKTWALLDRWADAVFFINYETAVTQVTETGKQKVQRGKGLGADHRIMYTRRTAAYDAKNRLGLPAEIDMGDSWQEGWANFISAMKQAKEEAKEGNKV